MKYRKIPVEIEAFKYEGKFHNDKGIWIAPGWILKALMETVICKEKGELYIYTLEGEMHVSVGDYIIQGVNGELYPCKPDIFEKTYVPANNKSIVTRQAYVKLHEIVNASNIENKEKCLQDLITFYNDYYVIGKGK